MSDILIGILIGLPIGYLIGRQSVYGLARLFNR